MSAGAQFAPVAFAFSQGPVLFANAPYCQPLMDVDLVLRGTWSIREDSLSRDAIHRFGAGQWDVIAAVIPGRSSNQCRERWTYRIGPGLNKNPFEKWEDELIVQEREKFGNHWTLISSHLPGRTSCAVKNRWYSVLRKHYRKRGVPKQSDTMPLTIAELLSHPVPFREELAT
jgi:hypothetical protein